MQVLSLSKHSVFQASFFIFDSKIEIISKNKLGYSVGNKIRAFKEYLFKEKKISLSESIL